MSGNREEVMNIKIMIEYNQAPNTIIFCLNLTSDSKRKSIGRKPKRTDWDSYY